MSTNAQTGSRSGLNSTSRMSFAVAACAFVAAGLGLLVNHWMSGWMAVGGMAGVGLFYLAIGLLNLGSTETAFIDDHDLSETSAHRLSGATNVDELAVEKTTEVTSHSTNQNMASVQD